uniref:Fatty acyl-CoA reductase n=1 Tax=Timema douglasi TaxID=61478 RepID=A0A7R8ZAN3_TIMDO|nr:unnamed protein product [Timema douglasi]
MLRSSEIVPSGQNKNFPMFRYLHYMIVTSKRFQKIAIFDSLKAANPSFHEKIVMVSGDISLAKLGFSPVDYEMLTRQVNIILHLAATVKFDEKVNIAVPINITGTKEIINLGRECVNLKSIVYASTAYSNCHLKDIKESFYTPPLEEDETINYLTTVDEVIMELIMPKVLGEWPNTYTFTKAIAENILRKTASDLPISIVRPSQITGTLKEPLVGWIDNFYGPNGLVAGVGMGLLKTFFNKGELKSEIIPGDLVINGIIVAAYDVGVR